MRLRTDGKNNYRRGVSLAERLAYYSMPEPNSGCLLWIGGGNNLTGYGRVWDSEQHERRPAHVVAWEQANGRKVPPGLFVCHRCDVRLCIEPRHLFLGTHDDNMKDMARKGRGRSGNVRGSTHGQSILTEDQVSCIRRDRRRASLIAKEHGIAVATVYNLRCGRGWRHVP